MRFLTNPSTGEPDEMVTIAMLVTIAVVFRFLVDGLTITVLGHIFNFTKIDASVYVSLLAPALGAHSYVGINRVKKDGKDDASN